MVSGSLGLLIKAELAETGLAALGLGSGFEASVYQISEDFQKGFCFRSRMPLPCWILKGTAS